MLCKILPAELFIGHVHAIKLSETVHDPEVHNGVLVIMFYQHFIPSLLTFRDVSAHMSQAGPSTNVTNVEDLETTAAGPLSC